MATKLSARTRRDRWADWMVILLVVTALALGWAVMAFAEGRTETYTDEATGLSVRYPRGWLVKGSEDLAFLVLDPHSGAVKTTYQVRVWSIEASTSMTSTLATVLSDASLSRAQEGTAYHLFDIAEGRELDGQPSMEATYAYVMEGSDPFSQQMPVVVEGLDVARAWGDRAYVFSLLAGSEAFAQAQPEFLEFVERAELR